MGFVLFNTDPIPRSPERFNSATARAHAGCPSTLMTLGRIPPLADNAKRRKSLAAVRSRLGDKIKSMVSPAESTARYDRGWSSCRRPGRMFRPPARIDSDAGARDGSADSKWAHSAGPSTRCQIFPSGSSVAAGTTCCRTRSLDRLGPDWANAGEPMVR